MLSRVDAREINGQQKREELNDGGRPEGSEDRNVAHVVRLAIETSVSDGAVDQKRSY